MAKKKAKKVKAEAGKKKGGLAIPFLIFVGICFMVVALPTTILLFTGLLPTLVCFMVDQSKGKARTMAVGAMNLATCTPFMFDLWLAGHSIGVSLSIISKPTAIIIMYMGAAAGYVIDWGLSGVITSILKIKAEKRMKVIEKRQQDLEERWGESVTGKIPLNSEGFRVEQKEVKR